MAFPDHNQATQSEFKKPASPYIAEFAAAHNYSNTLKILGIPDEFPSHGTIAQLHERAGISSEKIKETLQKHL